MADQGVGGTTTMTIVLATVVPVGAVAVAVAVVVVCWWLPRRRRLLFRRGIASPVDDEEIASWKTDRPGMMKKKNNKDNKTPMTTMTETTDEPDNDNDNDQGGLLARRQKAPSRKPASLIVYQTEDGTGPASPSTTACRRSLIDMPSAPPTPVLARAPNARPGLTDEAVQGEDAFVGRPRRHASRLAKVGPPPLATRISRHHQQQQQQHGRSKSCAGHHPHHHHHHQHHHQHHHHSVHSHQWYGQARPPRRSADHAVPSSSMTTNPSLSPARSSLDEDVLLRALPPRVVVGERKSEIGRAIG
ncbi:hypothetical protein L249_5828 [Ophiocordyceps polyrhachis-furcata BCC 54312]|uniref:Uncharacterized protein n=1 Tax=Ophiocordyceps polyrhachis-furcata BCC 54312 TaxID=1330021 RepID=A0A367L062_9HYPO|nr:hypothetical protein L249_5828 [Ophiocordyceps polyrhachis-furcata BCC 54312]